MKGKCKFIKMSACTCGVAEVRFILFIIIFYFLQDTWSIIFHNLYIYLDLFLKITFNQKLKWANKWINNPSNKNIPVT